MALQRKINDLFFTYDRGNMALKVGGKWRRRLYEGRFLYCCMLLRDKQ